MTPGPLLRRGLLAACVLVSAGVVALTFVPGPHSGGDNAGYIALAHSILTDGSYTEAFDPARPPHTKYPPVFPLVLAGMIAVGIRSWAGLKLAAAASTVLAVAAAWLWAERRVGALAASGVALLVALSSAVVYYSHWILSDPLFLALTMAALWAAERATGAGVGRSGHSGAPADARASRRGGTPRGKDAGGRAAAPPSLGPLAPAPLADVRWVAGAALLALLAYFTRSAGLPLVVALLAWLALARRWKALGVAAVAFAVPALAWWLRARTAGDVQYVSEFWMVNPYAPSAGTIGVADLVGRVVGNGASYATAHIPSGIVGSGAPWVALLGLALLAVAGTGWVLAVRRRAGPAELFVPLYVGLILLWPEVWSGDRFALPLFPVLFVYGAEAIRALEARTGPAAARALAVVALLALALPAMGSSVRVAETASRCRAAVARGGPFACSGPGFVRFAEAAAWSGAALPDGSAVLSRKPRIFYVMSGLPSRTFPFTASPQDHLGLADELGLRYELIDQIDGLAGAYVAGAVQQAPGAWCVLQGFGAPGGPAAQMLGIRPSAERSGAGLPESGGVRLEPCPADYLRSAPVPAQSPSSSVVPLLARRGGGP